MSWETRSAKGQYYTRSVRKNGRVERQYVGNGEFAELVFKQDERKRRIRELDALELRRQKESDKEIDQSISALDDLVECLTKGFLIAGGYHQHNRSEWRKRNEQA